ncbi:hypothetical protein BDZ97DRAFT_1764012 [Flammula alnicola]|nr:hypothetical protein BDZ97DRAFT_1764012 [Flammula alnicola]
MRPLPLISRSVIRVKSRRDYITNCIFIKILTRNHESQNAQTREDRLDGMAHDDTGTTRGVLIARSVPMVDIYKLEGISDVQVVAQSCGSPENAFSLIWRSLGFMGTIAVEFYFGLNPPNTRFSISAFEGETPKLLGRIQSILNRDQENRLNKTTEAKYGAPFIKENLKVCQIMKDSTGFVPEARFLYGKASIPRESQDQSAIGNVSLIVSLPQPSPSKYTFVGLKFSTSCYLPSSTCRRETVDYSRNVGDVRPAEDARVSANDIRRQVQARVQFNCVAASLMGADRARRLDHGTRVEKRESGKARLEVELESHHVVEVTSQAVNVQPTGVSSILCLFLDIVNPKFNSCTASLRKPDKIDNRRSGVDVSLFETSLNSTENSQGHMRDALTRPEEEFEPSDVNFGCPSSPAVLISISPFPKSAAAAALPKNGLWSGLSVIH